MIRSKSKNGITIEKEIELVMRNAGNTPWYYYIMQYILICTICVSICFCFITGLSIDTENIKIAMILCVMVAYIMAVYSFQSIFKYTGLITLFFYVMFGYVKLESLQAGYASIFNIYIKLYNKYFNATISSLTVPDGGDDTSVQLFLLFIMVVIVAITCYTAMYGKTMFFYILTTIPTVFLSFFVGYTPDMIPYVFYVVGTIALFSGVISEKYGIFSKVNKVQVGSFFVRLIEKARVKMQVICFLVMFLLFSVLFFAYSPERYENEFDAVAVKEQMQAKIKKVTSSNLLKDTIFNKVFGSSSESEGGSGSGSGTANSGLSGGELGQVAEVVYKNKTALKITTVDTGDNSTIYLKGYVGESYDGDSWNTLTRRQQNQLTNVISSAGYTGEEQFKDAFLELYTSGMYNMFTANNIGIDVVNIDADLDYDYVPYNCYDGYTLNNGVISSTYGGGEYTTYQFDLDGGNSGLTSQEKFFKYFKASAILQLNTVNMAILNKCEDQGLFDIDFSSSVGSLYDDPVSNVIPKLPTVKLSGVDTSSSESEDQTLSAFSMTDVTADDFYEQVSEWNLYSLFESQYFDMVKNIYTQLPEDGLDRVKELVADHQVEYSGGASDMNGYTTMDQIDTTSYAKKIYDLYKDDLGSLANSVLSSDLTYDELTNQDKMFEAISYVKQYLEENTTYSLSPGATPDGEDYVEYFLFENKKGYCMHYASAATVMLRAMGVPARYVEGYIVTPSDYKDASVTGKTQYVVYQNGTKTVQEGDSIEMNIKDTNAHAWVEVYLPGYGWTPIEMTSSYTEDGEVEVPEVNKDPNATVKPKATSTPSASASVSPTKTPSATASPSAANSVNKSIFTKISDWYDGLNPGIRRVISIILTVILLLALSFIVIMLRWKFILRAYAGRIQRGMIRDQILYEYQELSRIAVRRIRNYTTNESMKEYAASFAEKYSFISKEEAELYFTIVLKAKFGKEELSIEERSIVMTFHQNFISHIYGEAGKWRKLYYKYLFVMK